MPQLPLRLVSSTYPPDRETGLVGVGTPPPVGFARMEGPCPPAGVAGRERAAAVDRLRALVGSRGRIGILPPPAEPVVPGVPLVAPGHVSTGIVGLDAWLNGWPEPGPTELVGLPGSGRLALLIPLLERLTRQGRTAVIVDPLHQVHPPGLGRTDPSRIVLVRPPGERAGWAAEQVARSGAVDALLVLDAPPFGRSGVRLARAAEAGGMAVFVLSERPDAELPASLRLVTAGWREERLLVRCTRSRDGRKVGERWVVPSEAPPDAPVSIGQIEAVRRRRAGAV